MAQSTASTSSGATLGADNQSFRAIAERALQTSPDLLARRAALDAQSRGAGAASAAYGPRLDLSALAGYERSNRIDSAGAVFTQDGSSSRASLSLRQPLYDGSEAASETERLARLGNVRYFELRQAEDLLLLEMSRAWVDIARQRTLIEIAQANLAAHERLVALVQTRVASGVGRGVDLDQAQGRLSSTRLSLASDQGALGEASARFQRLALILPPAKLQWLAIEPAQLPWSENEALQQALAAGPAVRAAAENSRALEAEVRLRQAAFLPRIALEGRHDLTARTSTLRDAASSSLLLTFNYNLFAGGGDVLREQDAVLRLLATKQQFQDAVLGLRQGVSSAWAEQLRQSAMNLNALDYAGSVFKTRDVYRIQYEIGQRSLLDLLNTENELAQAQRQQTNSRADALQARLRLLSLSGRLHSVFNVPRIEAKLLLPPITDPVDVRGLMIAETMPIGAGSNTPNPSLPVLTLPQAVVRSPVVTPAVITPPAVAPPVVPLASSVLPKASPLAPTVKDSTERNALVVSRLAPGVEIRLPEALNRSLGSWLTALESGRDELIAQIYLNQQAFVPIWSAIGLSPTGTQAKRVRLIQVEQIDADREFKGSAAQLSVLAELNDAGGVRCIRSAQAWRNLASPEAPARWLIVRERAVAVAGTVCRSRS